MLSSQQHGCGAGRPSTLTTPGLLLCGQPARPCTDPTTLKSFPLKICTSVKLEVRSPNAWPPPPSSSSQTPSDLVFLKAPPYSSACDLRVPGHTLPGFWGPIPLPPSHSEKSRAVTGVQSIACCSPPMLPQKRWGYRQYQQLYGSSLAITCLPRPAPCH